MTGAFWDKCQTMLESNGLVTAFLLVGVMMFAAELLSRYLFRGRLDASAIAVFLGLAAAYIGGTVTGGTKGLADIGIFSGVGLLGGAMMRDFAIISTAYGADLKEIRKCGKVGVVALLTGEFISFLAGATAAMAFGYTDPKSITVIGAGAVSFVVGPVTASALHVESEVVAIAIAAGVVKSIAVMMGTPIIASKIGLTTPKAAMVYGGLMGTTSGTAAGLAATQPELVPYGAMTATFYTGLGCLLCPTVMYGIVTIFMA